MGLVEGYLDRTARYDAKLHAYIEVYADDARTAAQAAAAAIASGHRIGPFHGIPVAVKDIIEIEGRVVRVGWAQDGHRTDQHLRGAPAGGYAGYARPAGS